MYPMRAQVRTASARLTSRRRRSKIFAAVSPPAWQLNSLGQKEIGDLGPNRQPRRIGSAIRSSELCRQGFVVARRRSRAPWDAYNALTVRLRTGQDHAGQAPAERRQIGRASL